MVPGYLTSDHVGWMERTKDLWLQLEDLDVILVTWRAANRYLYSTAVADSPLVARQVTIFLYYLAELNDIRVTDETFLANVHIIGHSLGAHIAGFVGQDLNGRLGRITGLDPAGPSFDSAPPASRLDPDDAQLVDVVHTNSGKLRYKNAVIGATLQAADLLIDKVPMLNSFFDSLGDENDREGDTAWYGIDLQVGHIDYYANNGKVQPGCTGLLHVCDHKRANKIYEDMLKHELQLRYFELTKTRLQECRLLAFDSDDYGDFLTGNSLESRCPSTLSGRNHQNGLVDDQLNMCSIPIDLLKPVELFKGELETKHGLRFAPNHQPRRRYFFQTGSINPYVGDQYLVRLELEPKLSSWYPSCSLRLEMTMSNGISSTVTLSKEIRAVNASDFYGIATPFVNPMGTSGRDALINILLASNQTELAQRVSASIYLVVPAEVSLAVANRDSEGIFNAAKRIIFSVIRFGTDEKEQVNCRLGIVSLQVRPLIKGFGRNVFGLYGSGERDRDSLRVVTPEEHSKRTEVARGSVEILSVFGDSKSVRYLDGLIIG